MVNLNADPNYVVSNIMADKEGESYDKLNDATRLKRSTLFVTPQMVIDEIGSTVFKDIQKAENEREKAKAKENRKKRF